MSDTQSDDDLAASQFDDAKRSIDSVERSSGEAVTNVATAPAAGGGPAADAVADAAGADDGDLGLRGNDELTDGDAVR